MYHHKRASHDWYECLTLSQSNTWTATLTAKQFSISLLDFIQTRLAAQSLNPFPGLISGGGEEKGGVWVDNPSPSSRLWEQCRKQGLWLELQPGGVVSPPFMELKEKMESEGSKRRAPDNRGEVLVETVILSQSEWWRLGVIRLVTCFTDSLCLSQSFSLLCDISSAVAPTCYQAHRGQIGLCI